METETSRFINEKQAAAYLGLSEKTMQAWRWQRRGPRYHKFHGAVRYLFADLDEYARESRRETRDSLPEAS